MHTAFGVLMIVHGLITIVIWAPGPTLDAPMNTGRSWLLGDARATSVVLAVSAGVLLVLAGVGWLSGQGWWSMAGIAGGAVSLALFGLYFTPWWLIGIAISVSVVLVALRDSGIS